jgi:hypothetical protein
MPGQQQALTIDIIARHVYGGPPPLALCGSRSIWIFPSLSLEDARRLVEDYVEGGVKRVLNGYFAYHAVPTNLLRLDGFRDEVCRPWRHALLRRSQRHRLNWFRFNRLTCKYIPLCRVLHPSPEERFFASRP